MRNDQISYKIDIFFALYEILAKIFFLSKYGLWHKRKIIGAYCLKATSTQVDYDQIVFWLIENEGGDILKSKDLHISL